MNRSVAMNKTTLNKSTAANRSTAVMNKSKIVTRTVVPIRAKSIVNKTIRDLEQKKIDKDAKEKQQELKKHEIFEENLQIAVALLPTVPMLYAPFVRKWIKRLIIDKQLSIKDRNSFLHFLIYQMRYFTILPPFNADPPKDFGKEPTKGLIGQAKYTAIKKDGDKVFFERAKERLCLEQWGRYRREFKHPMHFLEDQPVPPSGFICYGGCFSNHFVKSYGRY